jgi:hypothetical protein
VLPLPGEPVGGEERVPLREVPPHLQRLAWQELQNYRMAALNVAHANIERARKEILIAEAWKELRDRLKQILSTLASLELPGPPTISGSVDYVVCRAKILKEYADAVLNVLTSAGKCGWICWDARCRWASWTDCCHNWRCAASI